LDRGGSLEVSWAHACLCWAHVQVHWVSSAPAPMAMSRSELGARLGALARRASTADTSLELPGIVWLEHINIVVGDRATAEHFYFAALGCSRDANGRDANIGQQQFHIGGGPDQAPQVVAGSIGLAMPGLDKLRARLEAARPLLSETLYDWADHGEFVSAVCPWGNTFYIWDCDASGNGATATCAEGEPLPTMHQRHLGIDDGMAVRRGPTGANGAGIRFVEFRCPDAGKCALFYQRMFGCHVTAAPDASVTAVGVGPSVHLIFSTAPVSQAETELARGIHICVYITNFATAYAALKQKGLIWTNPRFKNLDQCDTYEQACASRQFRFRYLVDDDIGRAEADGAVIPLLELEHETRSLRHFQFMKHISWAGL